MKPIKKFLNLIFILTCMSYIAFFAYLNTESTYIHLPYIGEFRIPAAVAFLSTFIAGAIFAGFYFVLDTAKKSFEIKRSRKELSALKREPRNTISVNQPDEAASLSTVAKNG